MQVGIDIKCMHTSFGGCGLSGFRDIATFQKRSMVIKKFNLSELAQKIHASRGQCHVHVHQFWWAWSLRFRRYGYFSKTAKLQLHPSEKTTYTVPSSTANALVAIFIF